MLVSVELLDDPEKLIELVFLINVFVNVMELRRYLLKLSKDIGKKGDP